MALSAMVVPTTFTARDRFSSVVNAMSRNAQSFGAGINRMNTRINNQMSALTRTAGYAAMAGGTALLYKAGEDLIQHEKAVASLGAVTGTVVGSMNKDIESLGKETNRSVIDITKGFELIGSKMSQYLKDPKALREVAKQGILMADASRMTVEASIENLTSLLNQFGKGSESANFFVNKLSAGEDVGASTIEETTDVLRQFAASARMAGADVSESIALVQAVTKTLGKQGVGRNFRNIMTDLNTGKGMDKNKLAALKMVGIDINKMINPATTFVDKMKELTKLSGNKQAMGMFFKKTGMEAGATFVRDFHYFEDYLKFIKENDTATAKATKNNATFAKGWQDLKSAFTNVIVSTENLNGGLNITKGLMGWMTNNMGSLINLVGILVAGFLFFKFAVMVLAARMLILNIAMGIAAFRATAMSISMQGNAVAIGVYNIATLIATGSTAALGVSLMTVLGPIIAIAVAIGALVYAFWDSGNAAEDMSSKQVYALSQSDAAMINSTDVMARELEKQKNLMKVAKIANPKSKEVAKMNSIIDAENNRKAISGALGYGKDMSGKSMLPNVDKSIAKKLYENKQMEGVLGKDKATLLRNNGFSFEDLRKIYPNIAGYENRPNQENKGEITIVFKGDQSNVSDVTAKGGFVFRGLPAKTGTTTGLKKQ